jgi:S1-C subfamily serine protease
MMLQSDQVPFDRRALDAISINVDDHPAIAHPEPGPDDRQMIFSEDDSNALHRQFEAGTGVLATMVFSPKGQPVTRRFSLEGYPETAAQYKGCRGLLLSPGWPGLHMTTAPRDPGQAAWLQKNTPYRNPGIIIVTVDPRKEAQKIDLRPGDLILGFNGKAAAEVGDLIRAMKALDPGKTIELDMVRGRTYLKKSIRRPEKNERSE